MFVFLELDSETLKFSERGLSKRGWRSNRNKGAEAVIGVSRPTEGCTHRCTQSVHTWECVLQSVHTWERALPSGESGSRRGM